MKKDFSKVKVGDRLTRYLGGEVPMNVWVSRITDEVIECGPWVFSKNTGLELDERLGWNETISGSYIVPPAS